LAPWEGARIAEYVEKQGLAVVLDEPPNTAATLAKTVGLLGRAGFPAKRIVFLLPVHPTRRDWKSADEFLPLSRSKLITLEPEEWYKARLLRSDWVEARLQEYLGGPTCTRIVLTNSAKLERLNAQLRSLSEEKFHTRLKRIYEVQAGDAAGLMQTRYILAKSVGWGFLSYHSFLAGAQLSGFVPPMLGLREGILFQQWLPADEPAAENGQGRAYWLNTLSSYVAARVRSLPLPEDPSPDLMRTDRHNGMGLLAYKLSHAYAWKPTIALMRNRVLEQIAISGCSVPTLTDSKMRQLEWIPHIGSPVKSDFEHHGLGKTELNITDPAFDLAEAILYFGLTETEERDLIQRYIEQCGDSSVEGRLFLHKLLAGIWALDRATANLADGRLSKRHAEFNSQYVRAFQFLIAQTARYCARFCRHPQEARWKSPVVVMDVDGVLDKQIFGFPSSTAAGIQALSLLHAHGFPIALNTARTLEDVKEYCRAYHCLGGVAEYGSVAWDAVSDRQEVLVSSESLEQLKTLREALRRIPGIFFNDDYHYSIRVYVYDREGTHPVPKTCVQDLLAELGLDRLKFFQTSTDTAVVAKEVDKGIGMSALLKLAGLLAAETLAVGDSDPDLSMFAAATRSYAPAHIPCWKVAGFLGCRIARHRYQRGLLEIARWIAHSDGTSCATCKDIVGSWPRESSLFARLLEVADQDPRKLMLQAVLHPDVLRTFRT
jgi:hydroxymethylpyrimidine pyrophosphatase-like HAD family hydrolase